jgi:hypothetical protein
LGEFTCFGKDGFESSKIPAAIGNVSVSELDRTICSSIGCRDPEGDVQSLCSDSVPNYFWSFDDKAVIVGDSLLFTVLSFLSLSYVNEINWRTCHDHRATNKQLTVEMQYYYT